MYETEQLNLFSILWKAIFTHSWIEELDHKAKLKLPAVLIIKTLLITD